MSKKHSTENIICIYHKNCTDGTFSAAVLLEKFPNCHLFPLEHGYTEKDLNEILEHIDKNTTVYITDFALRKDDLIKVLNKADKVINIDHHIGVKGELEEISKQYENFKFIFDNNSSGASLTWKVLNPDKEVPKLIKLVEDKDIWKWEFKEETKFANLYLYMFADKVEEAKGFLKQDIKEILEKGSSISLFVDYLILKFIENPNPTYLQIGDYLVKGFNAGNFQSELGNLLSEKYDEAVAIFNIKGNQVRFSFRSHDKHNPSALELAKILGGGGHRNASGAVITLEQFCQMIKFEQGDKNG